LLWFILLIVETILVEAITDDLGAAYPIRAGPHRGHRHRRRLVISVDHFAFHGGLAGFPAPGVVRSGTGTAAIRGGCPISPARWKTMAVVYQTVGLRNSHFVLAEDFEDFKMGLRGDRIVASSPIIDRISRQSAYMVTVVTRHQREQGRQP